MNRELEIARLYLKIQSKRFGKRLSFSIDSPEGGDEIYLPQLVIQTLVENAIKHGIEKSLDGGHIAVAISKGNLGFRLQVSNTGNLDASAVDGTGLSNTKKRLSHLYGPNHNFSLEEENGLVIVSFEFSGAKL